VRARSNVPVHHEGISSVDHGYDFAGFQQLLENHQILLVGIRLIDDMLRPKGECLVHVPGATHGRDLRSKRLGDLQGNVPMPPEVPLSILHRL
jgi:hypothetical protein